MEINSEEKGRFYSQYQYAYIVCDGVFNSLWYTVPDVLYGTKVHLGDKGLLKINDVPPLVLKPISTITDEDAINVTKIIGRDPNRGRNIDIIKLFTTGSNWIFGDINAIMIISATDYLRSKGYALPWMGLSVEEMVQAGWIKLITPHKT